MHIFQRARAPARREEDVDRVVARQLADAADVEQVGAGIRVRRLVLLAGAWCHAAGGAAKAHQAARQEADRAGGKELGGG